MTMHASRYLKWLAAGVAAVMSFVVSLNWLVDPFSLFQPPRIAGLNGNKPGYVEHLRLTHIYRLNRLKPQCVLLGTSRTGRGLRPDHPRLDGLDCYNMALPAIGLYEMRRYLQHAQALRPQELVVLSLDFRVFNARPDASGAFSESRLAVDVNGQPQATLLAAHLPDMASSLASSSALLASVTTLRKQDWIKDTLSANGFWQPLTDDYDHVAAFPSYTRNSARRFREALRDEAAFRDNLGQLRLLLRELYAHGSAAHLLIPPSHAWHWHTLHLAGLWPRFEEMKRQLVSINDEVARHAGRDPFPIWDFSGTYGPALEPVPTQKNATMRWFWEPVHYKSELGDAVIDTMFGIDHSSPPELKGLGVRLLSSMLEAHLARLRALQDGFVQHHPHDAARIGQLMSDVAKADDE